MRFWTIGESPDVRYSVCLIVRTSGSSAAWAMNRSTDAANESYGWWTRMSPARTAREHVGRLVLVGRQEPGWDDRRPRRQLEVGAIEIGDRPQAGEVEHPADLVAGLLVQPDAIEQDPAGRRRHAPLDLEPDGLAESAPSELLLDRQEEIAGLVLLDREVGVAGDSEQVRVGDLHAREQEVEVVGDDLVEQDPGVWLDLDEPRQHRRDLDPGEALLARLRIAQSDRDRQAQRADVRERVAGVDRERGQDREDLVDEPLAQPGVVLGDLVVLDDRDPLVDERLADLRERRRVLGHEMPDERLDPLELLGRRQAVGRQPRRPGGRLLAQTGHADLEELVEVAGEDRQELDPLEERAPRVLGLVEDASVPVEPGQLTVDVAQARLGRDASQPGWTRDGLGGAGGGHGP